MAIEVQGRCPRCHGRLVAAGDHYGRYRSCLSCGFVDECLQGPPLDLPELLPNAQRRRQPSHGHLKL